MGEVWLAEDPARGPVAVKQLHADLLDGDVLPRFRAEFAALARLRHPHLVEAYEYLVYPSGRHGYTMEYIPGLDFTAATGGLGAAEVVRLAEQVCEALQFVHEHDLIHGDVKPTNLLVREGRVKLMDFGLAERPGPRGIRGSFDYLAPEVIQGRPRDRRADLYSLGAVLFEALTRHPPFDGASRFALLRAHLRSHAEFPERTHALVPEPLRRVVLRLLCKEPSARFFTAAETAAALRASVGAGGVLELRPEAIGRNGDVVGRARELDAVEAALRDAATSASPRAIIVEGPPGSGKDALLRAFAARLAQRRISHAWGTASPGGVSLAPAREWIAELSSHVTPEWPRLRAALAAMEAGNASAARAAAAAIEACARRAPVVLLLHDAGWADESTVALVEGLRLAPGACLLFAGAATSNEGTAAWPGVPRLRLEPLEPAGTAAVARDATSARSVDPAFAAALHDATGGIPGAARACLRALAAEGALTIRDGTLHSSAPPSGGPGLERALAFLSTDSRVAAEALAVLGRSASHDEIARVSGLAAERVAGAVFDLERRGVAACERGPRARLAAPALARALLSAAPAGDVRSMHRAAAALEGASPESAARHLLDAGEGALAAIDAARHAAPAEAAALLVRAFAQPTCPPDAREAARPLLADCLARSGRAADASRLFEELAGGAEPGAKARFLLAAARHADPARAIALLATIPPSAERSGLLARAHYAAGRHADSLAEARAAGDAPAAARALLALGLPEQAAVAAGALAESTRDPAAALLAADAAAQAHDAPAASAAAACAPDLDPAASLDAFAARTVAGSMRLPPEEALGAWKRLAEFARVAGDADAYARAMTGAARLHTAHDRLGEAAECASEAVGARAPDRHIRYHAALAAAEAYARLGRGAAARQEADAAIENVAAAGACRALARAYATRARVALAAGDLAAALAAERAAHAADPAAEPLLALEVALARGDAAAVLAAAPGLPTVSPRDAATLALLRARALSASGEPIGLSASVDEFYDVLGRARALDSTSLARAAHAGLGRALFALGLGRSARDHLRLALDLLRDAVTHVPPPDRAAFLALPENTELRATILRLSSTSG